MRRRTSGLKLVVWDGFGGRYGFDDGWDAVAVMAHEI